MDIKPLFGLDGVLIAAMTPEFNDQVTSIALADIRAALGISRFRNLDRKSTCIGRVHRHGDLPWLLMTFTLRRWTLFAIALCGGVAC